MATYAIGDLQGCYDEFRGLLDKVDFGADDHLWLLGDLINRGPKSLETLRFVREIEDQCTVVLGNHDLHFLAIFYGGHTPSRSDTFDEILAAPDAREHAEWLRRQHLVYTDDALGYTMVHAGIPHIWSTEEAHLLADEVTRVIRGEDQAIDHVTFFQEMYGNEPSLWDASLTGMPRLRLITNYLTRMRLVNPQGALDFKHKGALSDVPVGWGPWFREVSPERTACLLFGHWAALDGRTDVSNIIALDTGCVWGRDLTALHLESGRRITVTAR